MSDVTLILEKLNDIEKRLEKIENGTNKMTNHVDFVENIYGKIKKPFHFLMDRASYCAQISYPAIVEKKILKN